MPRWLCLLLTLPVLASVDAPYREALPGYRYAFPRDHFEHADFKTEWWYYTGNVWTPQGRRFGFELVFFRQGNRSGPRETASAWRIDDLYLANAALTDIDAQRFLPRERLNRAGPGIAGASFAQQRIWNGNWSAVWQGERQSLTAVADDFSFHLEASPEKAFVVNGQQGISQKSAGAGHASHYVSFPLLRVTGTIQTGGRDYSVYGHAWMDHEWFTHQMEATQQGWDWFSVQLADKTELMLYDFRRKDGTPDPYSSGTFISARGQAVHLSASDFMLKPLEWWSSPKTHARYPVAWSIAVPSVGLRLECRARLKDQELAVTRGAKYWEGAVDYSGTRSGFGYLEMTGYDKALNLN